MRGRITTPTPCKSCNTDMYLLRNLTPDRRSEWITADLAPSSRGNIRIDVYRGTAEVLSGETLVRARADGEGLHLSHHATCPEVDRHRKPKAPALFDVEELG